MVSITDFYTDYQDDINSYGKIQLDSVYVQVCLWEMWEKQTCTIRNVMHVLVILWSYKTGCKTVSAVVPFKIGFLMHIS